MKRTHSQDSKSFKPRVQLVSPSSAAQFGTRVPPTVRRVQQRPRMGQTPPKQLIGYQKNAFTYLQRTIMGAIIGEPQITPRQGGEAAHATIKPYHSSVALRFTQNQPSYPGPSNRPSGRQSATHRALTSAKKHGQPKKATTQQKSIQKLLSKMQAAHADRNQHLQKRAFMRQLLSLRTGLGFLALLGMTGSAYAYGWRQSQDGSISESSQTRQVQSDEQMKSNQGGPENSRTNSAASMPLIQMLSPMALTSQFSAWSRQLGIDCAKSVFNSNQVHTGWQNWLSQAFQSSQTHNALLYLLINGIKDKRFVDESIVYGLDLIQHAVCQRSVIESSKQMTKDVLVNEPRVVQASLDLCKWFVLDPTVYNLTKDFMQSVHLRDDVYDLMIWQLACASYDGIQGLSPEDTPLRNSLQLLGFDLLSKPQVVEHARHHYLYLPMANTLTLGIYGMVAPAETPQASQDDAQLPEQQAEDDH